MCSQIFELGAWFYISGSGEVTLLTVVLDTCIHICVLCLTYKYFCLLIYCISFSVMMLKCRVSACVKVQTSWNQHFLAHRSCSCICCCIFWSISCILRNCEGQKVSNMRQIQHLGLQTGPKMNTSQATRGIKTSVGENMKPERFINQKREAFLQRSSLSFYAKIIAITFESKENNQP